jgi:hypothetical protein
VEDDAGHRHPEGGGGDATSRTLRESPPNESAGAQIGSYAPRVGAARCIRETQRMRRALRIGLGVLAFIAFAVVVTLLLLGPWRDQQQRYGCAVSANQGAGCPSTTTTP